jgi:hypothetical protein
MKKVLLSILTLSISLSLSAGDFTSAPTEGYRGFAGMNIFSGFGSHPYDRFAITTVHGIQSNNLYLGMGASMQFVTNNDDYYYCNDEFCYSDDADFDFTMPFFFNINYEMPIGKFAPFADLKLGYALGDVNGLYLLPAVGIRMAHFNMWCGYNLLQDKSVHNKEINITNYHSIALGITIDWGGRSDD